MMTPNTHQELVEKIASIMLHSWIEGEDDDEVTARSIISEIHNVLLGQNEEMRKAGREAITRGFSHGYIFDQMLARSPLVAQQTNETSDSHQ